MELLDECVRVEVDRMKVVEQGPKRMMPQGLEERTAE
jgi:hypothetical protein